MDLGSIFDLGGLRPFNGAHLMPLDGRGRRDGLGGFNIHTIASRCPITDSPARAAVPALGTQDAVIGIWATASRRS